MQDSVNSAQSEIFHARFNQEIDFPSILYAFKILIKCIDDKFKSHSLVLQSYLGSTFKSWISQTYHID